MALFASSVALMFIMDSVLFRWIFRSAPIIPTIAIDTIKAAIIPSKMEKPPADLLCMNIA